MIRYSLKCAAGHDFESWFGSASAYDSLKAAGQLSCPDCGSSSVEKGLMSPAVSAPKLSQPTDRQAVLAELRRQVEANSEYVGMNFAAEARRIHDGDAPGRSIYGEARPDEARALIEDGVQVAPLPFMPARRAN